MSITNLIAEIYEPGKETRELAEAAFDIAADDANREVAIRGWGDEILKYEASLWRPESRSGRSNGSGRFSESAARPDNGIFGLPVKTNDGTAYRLGDLTTDLCQQLRNEYRNRKVKEAQGEKFYDLLGKELANLGVAMVAELGQERVASLRLKAGYRE